MNNNMEERLVEEVRRYENLYNPSTSAYKDAQMTVNSWKEISAAVGVDVPECMKTWRRIRDKFVRVRKTTKGSSGDAGWQTVPVFLTFMSWLSPHIKHRETTSNYVHKTEPPSESATSAPAVSSESATSEPAVSSESATSAPAVSSESATSAPAVSSESATSTPAVSSESATSTPEASHLLLAAPPTSSTVLPSRATKRRRQTEQDKCTVAEVLSKLNENRQELYQAFNSAQPDSLDALGCWSKSMLFMARTLDKEDTKANYHVQITPALRKTIARNHV
ncbi:transcription factor Adf-1-like [Pleuronectes platessa]|uniref:transcription factor Adf-1-like n=1 Tax=Pleuronectes platessa TaxID=8262 RepID=UPI00232A0B6B|nr:transcription factor Adf-1-like [Pleuronectes platessa]